MSFFRAVESGRYVWDKPTWNILDPSGQPLLSKNGSRRAWSYKSTADVMVARLNACANACPLLRRMAIKTYGVKEDHVQQHEARSEDPAPNEPASTLLEALRELSVPT